MELYQLRSFAAVAELAHLTRAAEKLHISQPAVSAQIKALEDELGVILFERTPQGMLLTAAGRKLLPEAEKVVAAAQAVWHGTMIRTRSRDGCFKAFRLNHWLGFTVFAGVAVDAALRAG